MRTLFNLFLMLIFTCSFLYSQRMQYSENPYPKFVPYLVNQNLSQKLNIKIDKKDLGKEQSARWLSVDPMADKYPGWSPYNYAINNPLRIIDENGDSVEVAYTMIPGSDLLGEEHAIYHSLLILTDEESGEITTVEGMPENKEMGILTFGAGDQGEWGDLESRPETRIGDIEPNNRETVQTPEGLTDKDFRNNIVSTVEKYDSNAPITYKPFPAFIPNSANSNSYTYSVLKKAGAFHNPSKNSPGWYINIFK